MTSVREPKRAIAITSPSIARLFKLYKQYMLLCISNTEPILSLEEFYFIQLKTKEINRSRIFEAYLKEKLKRGNK